jgi:hypothetical protein
LPFEIRKASSPFDLSLSIRLGIEFKVVDKWYFQTTIAINDLNTVFEGDDTYSKTYQNDSKVIEQMGSTDKYLLLNFSVGINRYFGKR